MGGERKRRLRANEVHAQCFLMTDDRMLVRFELVVGNVFKYVYDDK